MKKLFFVLVLVLVIAPFAFAKEKPTVITGKVISVNTSANTLMVKERTKQEMLYVTDKTRILYGKEKKALSDIKEGDHIKAVTVQEEGKTVATSIHDMSKTTAKPVKQ